MHSQRVIYLLIWLLMGCTGTLKEESDRSGAFVADFTHGNFSDQIRIDLEQDTAGAQAYFTSLAQNAVRIPFREVRTTGDSVFFQLQSDFFLYTFSSRWTVNNRTLEGVLAVDSLQVPYTFFRIEDPEDQTPRSKEVTFTANGLLVYGTVWYSGHESKGGIVLVTSSGGADRSASRAEAIRFAEMGFTCFHYDKRGTGTSAGNWTTASMDELVSDDLIAIQYFSDFSGIPLAQIGLKGSSQGAAKIPRILTEMDELSYGILVSCPGVSLLESDLNFWRNRNRVSLGEDLQAAVALERLVFQYIAGQVSKPQLEERLEASRSEDWFEKVWLPNLDEVQVDPKLNYDPIPFFEQVKQPLLIIQGTKDEIIPSDSHESIRRALKGAGHVDHRIEMLEGANHSMQYVGESDFPYWSKLHPDYMASVSTWLESL